jgi:UDP-glucose 4-epimerase
MKILVTGASGFVGRTLVDTLLRTNNEVIPALRSNKEQVNSSFFLVSDINSTTDWTDGLVNINVVVHCAARVHVMNETEEDALQAFREVNTQGTLNLAQQAAVAGVKRFVFVSSIKVNGEGTLLGKPYSHSDSPCPEDPYGVSKAEAEALLLEFGKESGMEIVIIRPPLVYGPGVKANFAALMKLSSFGLPLPLGGITNNLRSLVYIDNLADLIITCIEHPNAVNKVFLVSDDEDISTASMLKLFSQSFGKSGFMIRIPVSWLKLLGKVTGKNNVIERLCGSLQVDITDTKNSLNWKPPVSVNDGFLKTVHHFQQHN